MFFHTIICSGDPVPGHKLVEKQHRLWFYICGFNIAILAGLFSLLFTRLLGKRWGALATGLAIGLYTCLVGAGASVVRAAVMAWMGLLGAQLGRQQTGSG